MASAAEAGWNPGGFPDNYRLPDIDQAVEELSPYVETSGRTIVDATPAGLGRNPEPQARIATGAGPHVVMGSGYTSRRD